MESIVGDTVTLAPKGDLRARAVAAKDVFSLFDGKRDLPRDTRVLAKWHNADSRSYTSLFYPGTLTEDYQFNDISYVVCVLFDSAKQKDKGKQVSMAQFLDVRTVCLL